MIRVLTLLEVKDWLRLEQGETAEDALLQLLIGAADEYVKNAVPEWIDRSENQLSRLLAMVLIADWYENREATGQVRPEMRPVVRSIVMQLQNAYPEPIEVVEP